MKVTEKRVRIVNKSKDGITLDFKGSIGLKKSGWDEFNKMYEICLDDKRYCVLRPEWKERMEKAGKLLNEALVYYLQIDWKIANPDPEITPDLTAMGIVGYYVEEISKLMECSYLEAMSLLNFQAIQFRQAIGGSGFMGLGASKVLKEIKKPEQTKEQKPLTNKISDFNPDLEKLREQLKNEEKK